MKPTIKLLSVLILLMCTLFVNAQKDSTTYKIKLEKFQHKERNGKIMTITGAPLTAVGGVLCILGVSFYNKNNNQPDTGEGRNKAMKYGIKSEICFITGGIIGALGVFSLVPGAINWSVGKKKVKEYQLKLDNARSGFYYGPNQVGLKLTFKF
jgi:hypothetical protein